jgi:acid phosphatase family membrane protein YuiD
MSIGLHQGFDSALFALAISMTMIVIYDAAGVRREAGRHAEKINILFNELLAGHLISDKELREVLGHTPMEVLGGICLGITVGLLYWMYIG